MTTETKADTLIVLTSGKQDRGTRATLAFAWACAAAASGREVAMYLTMDGTIWSLTGATDDVKVAGFEALSEYVEQFVALDGRMLVCAPCCEYYCSFDRAAVRAKLNPQVTVVGLATIVGMTNPETTVITL